MKSDHHKRQRKVEKLGLANIKRHIFICADLGECGCADAEQMKASWKYLKKRLKTLGLRGHGGVACSRTQCLDICSGGPIAVVYPEGTWYGGCNETVLEEIIQCHLLEGKVAEQHVIVQGQM